jgi:acetolactate synthase-1/2/3 large subunit
VVIRKGREDAVQLPLRGRTGRKSSLHNPDYAGYARAVGAVGITAEAKDQVRSTVEQMLAESGPCVVDFHVQARENVWPMVPAGKGLHEMEGPPVRERVA